MGLFNKLLGNRNNVDDESFDIQKADLLKFTKLLNLPIVNNSGCDQIPGAYGSFGITPNNPIPVNGVIGEMVYLFRLRAKTGVGFYYHRLGHVSSPPSSNPIDHYELVAADASEWCNLFFDCYYPRRSTKTPDGLTLLSWNSLDDHLKMMAKLPVGGVNVKVDNFPHGLPDAIESNKTLEEISPGLGSAIAKKTRIKLNEYKGQWGRKKKDDNNIHIAIKDDLNRAIDMLVAKGKKKGYLTYDDVNNLLPLSITTKDQIDIVISMLGENDIDIIEHEIKESHNEKIKNNKEMIGTSELGEKYFKLFVLDKTEMLFDKNELIKKLQIIKDADSVRELNILNIFSFVNHIGRTSLGNDIKDSIINRIINTYLNFIIQDANINEIDEEIKLSEIDKTEALISKRIKQYFTILKKYETSIFKKDKTGDNRIELEIMDDLVTILGNMTLRAYSEEDIFLRMSLFALFMELIMDKSISVLINADVSMYYIKNSELDDEMPDSVGNDFVITKEDNGIISIKKK